MSIVRPRIKAFFIHFLISLCIISIFVGTVLFVWYPSPFDYFYSPLEVLKIVLGVDLVLGPLLTLVLFDVRKKITELRMDISLVVLMQLIAFSWGVYVTYNARPVVLVFSNDTFYMFSKDEVDMNALTRKELAPKFWRSPSIAVVEPPKSAEEYNAIFEDHMLNGKPEITLRADRYIPLKEGFDNAIKYSINMAEVIKKAENKHHVDDFLNLFGGEMVDYSFFPIKGTSKSATLVLSRSTGEIISLIYFSFK